MTLVFPKDALILLGGNRLTDHNRSPLEISYERIAKRVRMANGLMRQYYIADKRTFSCSWEMVPGLATKTVDGFWGANDLDSFFDSNNGTEITLGIINRDGTRTNYTVMFTEFSKTLNKRWSGADYWDMSMTLEQV